MPGEIPVIEYALRYAARGMAIFPCHTVVGEDRACTCVKGKDCPNAGKHPHVFGGVKEATTDRSRITEWWSRWPNANVGIACGEISGIVVIDVDKKNGGLDSITSLERLRGEGLPRTHRVNTGGGGYHLFFKYPSGGCRNRNRWLQGVDVRANGYYVIAPPSRHVSGLAYAWSSPEGLAGFAELPVDVLENIGSVRSGGSIDAETTSAIDALAGVPEGGRDDALFKLACSLHRKLNGDREIIELAVLKAASRCTPPFPPEEALRKVDQAFKQDHSDPPAVPPAAAEDSEGNRRLTDLGNAYRLRDKWGDEVRWTAADHWLIWDGRRWATDNVQQIGQIAQDTAQSIWKEALAQQDQARRDALLNWARQSEMSGRLSSMMKEAIPLIARDVSDFDRDHWVLNCMNGTLDLRTGELRRHDRADLIRKMAPVVWNENARCPTWESVLQRILPDSELRGVLQRAIGYSLTGSTQEKKMFILRGEGDNGKTVITDVVRIILGDYASVASKALFIQSSRKDPDYELASLLGTRFALAAEEIARGEKLNAGLVKSMTGGDMMKARNPYKTPFTFTPELKLWLATNHLPTVQDFGRALWGRLCVFPFDVRIPKEEQIPRDELIARLVSEAAGILKWAVEGCLMWQEIGVRMTLEQEMVREDWKDEEKGHLVDFMEEVIVRDEMGFTSWGDMMKVYTHWCGVHGETHPYGRNKLKAALVEEGLVFKRGVKGSGWVCSVKPVGIGV